MNVHHFELLKKSNKTWHELHEENLSFAAHFADRIAEVMGSWNFIIAQTVLVVFWMVMNIAAVTLKWDPYPFILLNLLFSTQAAYAAPIIMMSQNRQSQRDRAQAELDYVTNRTAKQEIEILQTNLARIETEKLDEILSRLPNQNDKNNKRRKTT